MGNRELVAPASCVTCSEFLVTSAELGLALAQRVSWRGLRGGKGTWEEAQLSLSHMVVLAELYSQEEPWTAQRGWTSCVGSGCGCGPGPSLLSCLSDSGALPVSCRRQGLSRGSCLRVGGALRRCRAAW